MRPDPRAEAARWLAQAERDLDDARFAEGGERWNLACFLAQQAAEKAVKAFLYGSGRTVVLGHSVADLVAEAAQLEPAFEKLHVEASKLDRLYVPTRYPNGLPGGVPYEAFHQEDARDALAGAERVLRAVRERLGPR